MKKVFIVFLLIPIVSIAQTNTARFENDTLYTSSGFKIFEGQTLKLAKGTSAAGYFRYVKFHNSIGRSDTYTLQNSDLLVTKLKNFKYAGPENSSIRIQGTATLPNNKKQDVDVLLNFEMAISGYGNEGAELIVPAEFKNSGTAPVITESKPVPTAADRKPSPTTSPNKQSIPEDLRNLFIADEIKKLYELLNAGALTKTEYEAQKKKLLERQ